MPTLEDSLKIDVISDEEPPLTLSPVKEEKKEVTFIDEKDTIPLEGDDDELPSGGDGIYPTIISKPDPSGDMFEDPPPEPPPPPPVEKPKQRTNSKGKVTLNKNGKQRKQLSEESLQKLALARKKASEKRRLITLKKAPAKAEKERLKKLKKEKDDKELEDLRKEVGEPVVKERPPTPPPPAEEKPPTISDKPITRAELEEISMKTIIAVETLRKKRKEEKKKKQEEAKYQSEVMDTIRKAQPSWFADIQGTPYEDCF